MFIEGEELLEAVRRHGWDARRQQLFLQCYGPLLRRALLSELGRRFGSEALRGLGNYLRALEQGGSPSAGGVSGQLLELACNTWQEACWNLFRAEGHTIMKYFHHQEQRAQEGRAPLSFESFLWGLIRLKLRQQLPRCRAALGLTSSRADEDMKPESEPWEERRAADIPIEEFALADEIDFYWEGLLRCGMPEPGELEQKLHLGERWEHLLCWACCSLKRKLPARRRENLLAFVTFFVSQRGAQRPREPLPPRQELSLETLSGRYLRWEEDVCRLFGKDIRKDRVLAQIREELLRSSYGDLVKGGET